MLDEGADGVAESAASSEPYASLGQGIENVQGSVGVRTVSGF